LGTPLVSVGIPIFNKVESAYAMLESVNKQSYRDLEIIIADDSSTDGTFELIESYIWNRRQPRIIRNLSRIGMYQNFNFVLQQASGKYFFWLAGDDKISEDYIGLNVSFLENNPDFIASSSSAYFSRGNLIEPAPVLDLRESPHLRIVNLTKNLESSHNVFYSVVRLEAVKKFKELEKSYAALDWSYDFYLVMKGKVETDCGGSIIFGTNGISRVPGSMKSFANNLLERALPYFRFSLFAFSHTAKNLPNSLTYVTSFLVKLNLVSVYNRGYITIRNILKKVIRDTYF